MDAVIFTVHLQNLGDYYLRVRGLKGPRIQVKRLTIIKKESLLELQGDIGAVERMLKVLIKSLENKPLDP